MRTRLWLPVVGLTLWASAAIAQTGQNAFEGDYIASSGQAGTNQQRVGAPLIGLRRQADFLVYQVSFTSDSRDATVRLQEIHAMLLDALGKAAGAGLELATGNPVLTPLTRQNYQAVNLTWAGREDTSQAAVMIKVPMPATPADAEKRIYAFLRTLETQGRGTKTLSGSRMLGVRNPDQHRQAIVALIAADVRTNAEAFGPDYRAVVDGIDKPVQWTQVGSTDVFLFLPYSYRLVAN